MVKESNQKSQDQKKRVVSKKHLDTLSAFEKLKASNTDFIKRNFVHVKKQPKTGSSNGKLVNAYMGPDT